MVERVTDRKAHDRRYSVDITKISTELGYRPLMSLRRGPGRARSRWYRDNRAWWEPLKDRAKLPGN